MDEQIARNAFERALETHSPGFGSFFLARMLELVFSYADGRCRVDFPVRDYLFNPGGTLHGGIIATIMDMSMGHLLRHELGVGGATLEIKLQFLRPIVGTSAHCEGTFLKRGRTVCFLKSRMYDAREELAVVATSTWQPRAVAISA